MKGMSHQVTLTISDNIFQQAYRLARQQSRQVEEILADSIRLAGSAEFVDWSEPNSALDREMAAYVAMHPQLKHTMRGKHVAVFGEELVDSDDDFDRLVERVRRVYPQQTVWLTTVGSEPIDTIYMRSPRLLPE